MENLIGSYNNKKKRKVEKKNDIQQMIRLFKS